MTGIDFGSPFMAAKIIVGEDSYPLWIRGKEGESFDKPTPSGDLKALSYVSEISVKKNLGWIPEIRITLSPPYEDAIKLLDSDILEFSYDRRLQVYYGYTTSEDGPVLQFEEGLRNQPPEWSFGQDITIALTAQGVGGNYHFGTKGSQESHQGKKLREIVLDVVAHTNWEASFEEADKDPNAKSHLDAVVDLHQAGQTDEEFLTRILDNAGMFYNLVGPPTIGIGTAKTKFKVISKMHLIQEGVKDRSKLPILAFYRLGVTLGKNEYPVLSASTGSMSALFASGVGKTLMREISKDSRKLITKEHGIEDIKPAVSSSSQAADIDPADGLVALPPDPNSTVGYHKMEGDPEVPSDVAKAQSVWLQYQIHAIPIEVKLELLGCPTLYPSMPVGVRGFGQKIDGDNYTIYEVEHVLNASGYITRVTLRRNTNEQIAKSVTALSKGPSNKNEADLDGNDNVVAPTTSGGFGSDTGGRGIL